MLIRLIDLVVRVAELSHKHEKAYWDLEAELSTEGYSDDEIAEAIHWFSNRGESGDTTGRTGSPPRSQRILSDWERFSLSPDCYGFLLRLRNLGILDDDSFERVLARCLPVGSEKVELVEVKAIAGSVLFNHEGSIEDELFGYLEEEIGT